MKRISVNLLVLALISAPVELLAKEKEPVAGMMPGTSSMILQVVISMVLVLIMIVGAAWFFRRISSLTGLAPQAIRVVGGLSLGARERMVLVEVGGEQLLVGVSPGRINLIHILNNPLQIPSTSTEGNSGNTKYFGALIAQLIGSKYAISARTNSRDDNKQ